MTVNIELLVYVAGIIVAFGSAWKVVKDAKKGIEEPRKEIKKDLKGVNNLACENRERLDEHDKLLQSIREDNQYLLSSMLKLLRHAETGNHTNELKHARESLEKYIIER